MLGFHSDKYDQYKFEYERFVKSKSKPRYSALSLAVNYNSEIVNLMRYESLALEKNIFLIVPSIFNSPEILFLSGENNFVQNLRQEGEVYLVNWKETNSQLKIEDLVCELQEIINFIGKNNKEEINLVGHCIGGNICVAAVHGRGHGIIPLSTLNQTNEFQSELAQPILIGEHGRDSQNSFGSFKVGGGIRSLSLLTTPWDFAHFGNLTLILENFVFENVIKERELIPKIYVQILFFLMFPSQYKEKIDKYFALSPDSRELFLQVEDWLQSGISIPKSLYLQIIEEFCLKNIIYNKEWKVNGSIVDLEQIDIPTCIIYAKKDQIVPYSSIVPLQKMIKNSTLIEVEGGHAAYLISPSSKFQQQYKNWLQTALVN